VRLDEIEARLLKAMFDDLAEVVERDAFEAGDPVRARLYPAGYRDDTAASDDFRELTESSLRAERSQRARACADDITGPGEVVLDADGGQRWIQALNDLRLALGTRLNVTEDADYDDYDEYDEYSHSADSADASDSGHSGDNSQSGDTANAGRSGEAGATGGAHPAAQEWAIYHWLTALQDGLVRRLMRR
jgi:hypothetical protein